MQKVIFILYFIGLFAILSSYIVFSEADTSIRMSIATSDEFSQDRPNYIRVIVRNLKNGSKFEGYSLRACRRQTEHDPATAGSSCTIAALPENGVATFAAPRPASQRPDYLCVALLRPGGTEEKSACLPPQPSAFDADRAGRNAADAFVAKPNEIRITGESAAKNSTPEALAAPNDRAETGQNPGFAQAAAENAGAADGSGPVETDIFAPGAFLFGVPNEVLIRAWQDGRASQAPLSIKQIYGSPASFSQPTAPSEAGISRFSPALQSAADFEIAQNGQKFYASFSPNEKPLSVAVSSPMINPGRAPSATVTPFGSAARIAIDVFDGMAWIDHIETDLNKNQKITLDTDFSFIIDPKILYFRVSTSLFANAESSQTIAAIASPDALPLLRQAELALEAAIDAGASRFSPYRALLPGYSPQALADVRDIALAYLSLAHNAEIATKKRTEIDDLAQFNALKSKQKSISNIIFIAWIVLGFGVISSLGIAHALARRRAWDALPDASPEGRKARAVLRAFHIALIAVLSAALAALIYCMMQLI